MGWEHYCLLDQKPDCKLSVGDSCRWMNCNDLKLNENKTEVVFISSKFRNGTYLDYVSTHCPSCPCNVYNSIASVY